jgi:hypothetical protein
LRRLAQNECAHDRHNACVTPEIMHDSYLV